MATSKETAAQKRARLEAEAVAAEQARLLSEKEALEQQLANEQRAYAQQAEALQEQLRQAQQQIADQQMAVQQSETLAQEKHAEAVNAKVETSTYKNIAHQMAEKAKKDLADKYADLVIHIDNAIENKLPHVKADVLKVAGLPKWARWALLGLLVAVGFALVLPHFQNKAIEKRLEKLQMLEKRDSALTKELTWMDWKQQETNKMILSIQARYDTAAIDRAKRQIRAYQQIENNKKQKDAFKNFVSNPNATYADKLDLFTNFANGAYDSDTSQNR